MPAGGVLKGLPGPLHSAVTPAVGIAVNDLLQLSAPWWHFVLRGVVIYVMVMVLMRISGKRAVGQFTPFDLVLLILIGNAVQNGINGGDNSLTGAVIMAGTLIGLNLAVAWGSARWRGRPRSCSYPFLHPARLGPFFRVNYTTFWGPIQDGGIFSIKLARLLIE